METCAVHVCPHCRNLQPLTAREPRTVVCLACGYLDVAPITSRFGAEEWDVSDHSALMFACLKELGIDVTPRKCRLISCAAARTRLPVTDDDKFREAIALAETWADAGVRPKGVPSVRRHLNRHSNAFPPPRLDTLDWSAIGLWCLVEDDSEVGLLPFPFGQLLPPIYREQFGNPFVPTVWKPHWLTPTVRDLAAHVYAAHEFGAMPILADALQDAGCDDEQVLTHCRTNKLHARGCWVLDAILGKS